MKEVLAPAGASIDGPRTGSHKKLALMDEEESKESRDPYVRKAQKRAHRSPKQGSSEHRGSTGGSPFSSSEGL